MKKIVEILLLVITGMVVFVACLTTDVQAATGHSYVHVFKKYKLMEEIDQNKDFTYKFAIIKHRTLKANTDWLTDKVARDANNTHYYRVATNEWIDTDNAALVNRDFDQPLKTFSSRKIYSFNAEEYTFTDTGKRLPVGNWACTERIQLPRSASYCNVGPNEWVQNIQY